MVWKKEFWEPWLRPFYSKKPNRHHARLSWPLGGLPLWDEEKLRHSFLFFFAGGGGGGGNKTYLANG